MYYCGLDLAGVSSYAYVTNQQGSKMWAGPVETTKTPLTSLVKRYLSHGLSISIEAGNQTAWVHELLVKLGAKVTVVNPTKVKLIAESRRKTNKVDAKILCELLRLDGLPHPVHMPGEEARALRGLLVARRQLVTTRSKICNVVRGMLRQEGVRLKAGELSSKAGWQRVFHRGFEREHVLHIVNAYYQSFLSLTKSIRELDTKLAELEKKDERIPRLKTMPKVGRIASLTFVAAVDNVQRFSSSRKLVGYRPLLRRGRSFRRRHSRIVEGCKIRWK